MPLILWLSACNTYLNVSYIKRYNSNDISFYKDIKNLETFVRQNYTYTVNVINTRYQNTIVRLRLAKQIARCCFRATKRTCFLGSTKPINARSAMIRSWKLRNVFCSAALGNELPDAIPEDRIHDFYKI